MRCCAFNMSSLNTYARRPLHPLNLRKAKNQTEKKKKPDKKNRTHPTSTLVPAVYNMAPAGRSFQISKVTST